MQSTGQLQGGKRAREEDGEDIQSEEKLAERACTECVRRKGKCDKRLPACSKCIARKVPHLCRTSQPEIDKLPDDLGDAGTESLKALAFKELEALRLNVVTTNQRIARLELLFSNALARAEPSASPEQSTSATSSHQISSNSAAYAPNSTIAIGFTPFDGLSETEKAKGERTQDVHADVTLPLEYIALGRHKDRVSVEAAERRKQEQHETMQRVTGQYSSPAFAFPGFSSPEFLIAGAPSRAEAETIVSFAVGSLGWLTSVIFPPTFMRAASAFWAAGEGAFATVSPAWCALYFAVLASGAALLSTDQRVLLGYSQERCIELAHGWATCSISALYRSNFLAERDLTSLQTICIYHHTGRDVWSTNQIAPLLAAGLSLATEMNLHRMASDEAWSKSVEGQPGDVRTESLITREISKRVFWGLCREDWFSINWRRRYTLRPSQISTPLPLNIHDSDLSQGRAVDQPPSVYTAASLAILNVHMARFIQSGFQYVELAPNPGYDEFLTLTEEVERFLAGLPSWWRHGPPTEGMTSSFLWLRSCYAASTNHGLITLHRPFLFKALNDSRYLRSREIALRSARAILREAHKHSPMCPVWTVVYHCAVSCFIGLCDLFERKELTEDMAEQRQEITEALAALRMAQSGSDIARRSAELIARLLEDEAQHQLNRILAPAAVDINAFDAISAPVTDMPSQLAPELVGGGDPLGGSFQQDFSYWDQPVNLDYLNNMDMEDPAELGSYLASFFLPSEHQSLFPM